MNTPAIAIITLCLFTLIQYYRVRGSHRTLNRLIADMTRAISEDSTNIDAYFNRGRTYRELGKLALALGDAFKILEISPHNDNGYVLRGNIYADLDRHADAFRDYCKAIEINPRNAYAHYNRAAHYFTLKKLDLAQSDIEQALLLNPYDEAVRLLAGYIYYERRDLDSALVHFNEFSKLRNGKIPNGVADILLKIRVELKH